MARPRRPSRELAAKGSFAHNPGRGRIDLAGSGIPLPICPPDELELDEYEQRAWVQLVTNIPEGLSNSNDIANLELGARLLGKVRRDRSTDPVLYGRLLQILGSLGQTSTGRAALATPAHGGKLKPPSKLDQFRPKPAAVKPERGDQPATN